MSDYQSLEPQVGVPFDLHEVIALREAVFAHYGHDLLVSTNDEPVAQIIRSVLGKLRPALDYLEAEHVARLERRDPCSLGWPADEGGS